MRSMQNILVSTDFSNHSEIALSFGKNLARITGATLHVLTVVEPLSLVVEGSETLQAEFVEQGNTFARTAMQKLAGGFQQEGIVTRPAVNTGHPVEQILLYASENNIDCIVMGTHGRRGVQRLFLGSVAEEILHRAHCPVMVVNNQHTRAATLSLETIVVPIDCSDYSDFVVEYGVTLANLLRARVELVHVVEPSKHKEVPAGLDVDFDASLYYEAGEQLKVYAGQFIDAGIDVQTHLLSGYADETITTFSNTVKADMICVGAHGKRGSLAVTLGSTATRIVRNASCPVLAVRLPDRTPAQH